MERRIEWMGIAGALVLLAATASCRDDGVTGPERAGDLQRGVPQVSLRVIPEELRIDTGGQHWLTAILEDSEGNQLNAIEPVYWTSSNASAVELSGGDMRVLVRGQSAGFSTITARYGALTSRARVIVYASAPDSGDEKHEVDANR